MEEENILREHPMSDYLRQQELEEESSALGIKRYREALASRGELSQSPGMELLNRTIEPLTVALQTWVEDIEAGKVKRGAAMGKFLREFEGDFSSISFLVAKKCLGVLSTDISLTHLASMVGAALEDELEYRQFAVDAPGLYHTLLRQLSSTSSERHRRKVVMHTKNKYEIKRAKWGNVERVRLGTIMIHMFMETTNLVKRISVKKGKKTVYKFGATETTEAWLTDAHARNELLSPVHMPMVVPPRPWTSVKGGGYLNQQQFKTKLIKTYSKGFLEEMDNAHMPKVYESVNNLQETPWKVNSAVLRVMREVWDGGGSLGKLPSREGEPLPAKPEGVDEDPELLKEWKHRAAKVYQANVRLVSKRIAMSSKLWMAEKFADEEAFYYVWNLDWRGRAYPMSSFMNPQGDDTGKALLTFADGCKLGETGAYSLAVHIANLFGIDKCSLDERVEWVEENTAAIIDSAMNPIGGDRFWCEADKPWCALAGCFEWLGYTIEGDDYVSHLPCASDGSCNGLQNFSAALLDSVGGKATNLIPCDQPQDIYNEVKAVVDSKIPKVSVWSGKVTRRLCKRPVMTLPYGASKFGMRDQLLDEIQKLEDETGENYLGEGADKKGACAYLAKIIYESIGEVVIAASKAMTWLQDTARLAVKNGLPLHWETPMGFTVMQSYRKAKGQRVLVTMGTESVRLQISEATDVIDRRRMAQGIAPNFVHSMDAAHMMATILKCREAGVQNFAMIHDSFGTHAANTEVMNQCLREAFVEQYSTDVLKDFQAAIRKQMPIEIQEKLPDIPESGDLDLSLVLESEYFFA